MNSADFFKSYVNDLREQQDAYMPPVGVNPILLDAFDRMPRWVHVDKPAHHLPTVRWQGKEYYINGQSQTEEMQEDGSVHTLHSTPLEGKLGVPVQSQGSGTWTRISQ